MESAVWESDVFLRIRTKVHPGSGEPRVVDGTDWWLITTNVTSIILLFSLHQQSQTDI